MNWSKLAVLVLLLVIMFTVSVFGARFGYTVNGVPKGIMEYKETEWREASYGIDVAIAYWQEKVAGSNWVGQAISFFGDMITFKVDNMPAFFSIVFIIMTLLSVYIVISLFLPGGGN